MNSYIKKVARSRGIKSGIPPSIIVSLDKNDNTFVARIDGMLIKQFKNGEKVKILFNPVSVKLNKYDEFDLENMIVYLYAKSFGLTSTSRKKIKLCKYSYVEDILVSKYYAKLHGLSSNVMKELEALVFFEGDLSFLNRYRNMKEENIKIYLKEILNDKGI